MIPISDDNPTLRTPIVTILLLATLALVWVLAQGAGGDPYRLIASVCNYGMVPGELTGGAPLGLGVPMGGNVACVVDDEALNVLTPLTSMFLHGSWMHLLGNALFLWVFGNNVEDSMGRLRFLAFYLICGLVAAATHVLLDRTSPIPTVGASGAISGVLGGYLVLYPHVRVRTYFPPIFLFRVPAWLMLILWFGQQVLAGLPQLSQLRHRGHGRGGGVGARRAASSPGVALVRLFRDRGMVRRRAMEGDAQVAFGQGG